MIRLALGESTVRYEVLTSELIELPRINYHRCNAHSYQFVYGVGNSRSGNFIDQLVKVNVQDGTTQIWRTSNCYPVNPYLQPLLTLQQRMTE